MEHIAIPLGDIHKPHNWEFASADARASASGFLPEEVGAVALQLDDGSYWRLSANSPAVWAPFVARATISTDPDNRLALGSDSGLFVPDILVDPLAYYILSRS